MDERVVTDANGVLVAVPLRVWVARSLPTNGGVLLVDRANHLLVVGLWPVRFGMMTFV
jgi:hypothetical protein